MKPFKILAVFTFSLLLGISTIVAQDTKGLNLSNEQKELLQAQKQLIKKNREAFKASLSKEQLAILKNTSLTKQARQLALKNSLTSSQKSLIAQNKLSVQNAKMKFRGTLTKSQKQKIKKRIKTNKGQNRNNIKKSVRDKRRRPPGGN